MIDKGWFRQGHLDQENTCLIVSHDTYQEYQKIQQQREQQRQLEMEEQKQREGIFKTYQGKQPGNPRAGDFTENFPDGIAGAENI